MAKRIICLFVTGMLLLMIGCSNQASPGQASEEPDNTNSSSFEQPNSIDPELIISNSEMESVLGFPVKKTIIPGTAVSQYESAEDESQFVQIGINLVPASHRPFSPVKYYKDFIGFKEVDIGDEACFILVNKLEIQRGDYTISIQLNVDSPESVGTELGKTICDKLDVYLAE